MGEKQLWDLGLKSIQDLETENGILASAKEEIYGCIFGRDSIITALTLLNVYEKTKNEYFLSLVTKVLVSLSQLQGTRVTLESGEEPGKCIHEFRPTNHERLTGNLIEPWYVYPDNILRNYDSVDATPLFLILFAEYFRVSNDRAFIEQYKPNIMAALNWVLEYGDSDGDGFIDYTFHATRTHGGLKTQSWMDSDESRFFEKGDEKPEYPIAPVEVQAYAFTALYMWSQLLVDSDLAYAQQLMERARNLKVQFNQVFVMRAGGRVTLAYAVDGQGRRLTSARSSMGHCLWAVARDEGGRLVSVLEEQYIPQIVHRLLSPDMFVSKGGVRTLSSRSRHFDPVSYHNGSIWPHDTAILAQGLENFGYTQEAKEVRRALVFAYAHFKTPIELFGYLKGKYREYVSPHGGGACRTQAWSAASLLTATLEVLDRP